MKNQVEVLIQPTTLRFSIFNGDIYYLFASNPDAQLDQAELFMGINPGASTSLMDSNLGFLPVSSTVLIRGEKNILIDPNNHHIGFYGLLGLALKEKGLSFDDIDVVVVTHWHHDHSANVGMFKGELVVGNGELEFGKEVYGEEEINGKIKNYSKVVEIDDVYEITPGVKVYYTPGHTPGSICVFVDDGIQRTAVMGDSIMTKKEWIEEKYSHWYTKEQLDGLSKTAKLFKSFNPTSVIPGHDRIFSVKKT